MTYTWQLSSYLRGTLVTVTQKFYSDPALTIPADPTTITATVLSPINTQSYTYGTGSFITKVSVGVYTVTVDTTPANGKWYVRWMGTGAIQAPGEDPFWVWSAA